MCNKILNALMPVVLALPLVGTACADEKTLERPATRGAQVSLPEQARYALSEKAQRVARLLDRNALEAAQRLLNSYLDSDPDDAGLHCQYVRFLIEGYDPANPVFILTPLKRDDKYLTAGIAAQAAVVAAQLEPKCKAYLADVILRSLHASANRYADNDSGLIGRGLPLFGDGFDLSMVNMGWRALEIDPAVARAWAEPYRVLLQRYVRAGKIASAMMCGNLLGDMLQAGKGAEDFRQANAAFLAALDTYKKDDFDWVACTANKYPSLFAEELRDIAAGKEVDPVFAKLNARLRDFGTQIPALAQDR